jgi:hypothetical protein
MAKPYRYRATLTNVECYGKRPIAFADDNYLDFWEAGQEAVDQHLFSQTCLHCGENHSRSDYVITDLERGEWSPAMGDYQYRDVYPARSDECHPCLELDL